MSKKEIYTCDECGAERREANHWFAAALTTKHEKTSNGILVLPGLAVFKWADYERNLNWIHDVAASVAHICGEQCLQKFVAKWAQPERTA